jgi:hypothetical protein
MHYDPLDVLAQKVACGWGCLGYIPVAMAMGM